MSAFWVLVLGKGYIIQGQTCTRHVYACKVEMIPFHVKVNQFVQRYAANHNYYCIKWQRWCQCILKGHMKGKILLGEIILFSTLNNKLSIISRHM